MEKKDNAKSKEEAIRKKVIEQLEKVDSQVQKMRTKEILKNGDVSKPVSTKALKNMLQNLQVMEGRLRKGNDKEEKASEHKFWNTQPVPKKREEQPDNFSDIGPIEPSVGVDQVEKKPLPLPKDFEWCEIDMKDESQVKELYGLLTFNYVEDDDANFRFDYSARFLEWALLPPGWKKSWHVGVRVVSNKKLVAFISGVPAQLRTGHKVTPLTEINYLCIHKKLRSKRLAPVLIKEITRRSHLEGIFQAVYTAGASLPEPVSTCRYYHRSLNPKKLVECEFSRVKLGSTITRMVKELKIPEETSTPNLREMRPDDVPAVRALLNEYLKRFDVAPYFDTDEDVSHWILPHEEVVWSYVVESPKTQKITDMFSFYSLPSTVINNPKHSTLNAAYMFYYAIDVTEDPDYGKGANAKAAEAQYIKKRLTSLLRDALVLAKQAGFDVVNALNLMDNGLVVDDLKFGKGDGFLHYYLYNWRCPPVPHEKVGLVML